MRGGEDGATLIETLVGLLLLGVALGGILPSLTMQVQGNSRSATRSGAVIAAQRVLDGLRLEDVTLLPTSGTAAPVLVTVSGEEFEVTAHYCTDMALCSADSRHILVEVRHDGQEIYDAATVYTQLR